MRKRLSTIILGMIIIARIFISTPVFAHEPVLPNHDDHGLSKQNLLDQILPRATVQAYGNIVVYSTVGLATQQRLERWSRSWDVLINMLSWWWIDQIPRPFKIIMVSESEYDLLVNVPNSGAVFVYPDEVQIRGYRDNDVYVIHEALHRILSWVYIRNVSAFPNELQPGASPLITAAAQFTVNGLNAELGPNPNGLIIDLVRFNRLWEIIKQIIQVAGFIGLERISAPQLWPAEISPLRSTDVWIRLYQEWQRCNGTGEIYIAITMFSAILDFYNHHRDETGIFNIAVCNAKKILDRELGFVQFEQVSTQQTC